MTNQNPNQPACSFATSNVWLN